MCVVLPNAALLGQQAGTLHTADRQQRVRRGSHSTLEVITHWFGQGAACGGMGRKNMLAAVQGRPADLGHRALQVDASRRSKSNMVICIGKSCPFAQIRSGTKQSHPAGGPGDSPTHVPATAACVGPEVHWFSASRPRLQAAAISVARRVAAAINAALTAAGWAVPYIDGRLPVLLSAQ